MAEPCVGDDGTDDGELDVVAAPDVVLGEAVLGEAVLGEAVLGEAVLGGAFVGDEAEEVDAVAPDDESSAACAVPGNTATSRPVASATAAGTTGTRERMPLPG